MIELYRSFSGLKVQQSVSGATTQTIICNSQANSIVCYNDSGANLTLLINGITCTTKTGEMFDESFEPFNNVTVTATGAYRILLRW